MLQQVMTAPGVIEFNEVPVPEVKPGQVLVKIQKIGICGSDIHVYHGKPSPNIRLPKAMRFPVKSPRWDKGWKVFPSGRRSRFSLRWYAENAIPAATESIISARS